MRKKVNIFERLLAHSILWTYLGDTYFLLSSFTNQSVSENRENSFFIFSGMNEWKIRKLRHTEWQYLTNRSIWFESLNLFDENTKNIIVKVSHRDWEAS